jgi:hypothetical protein
VTLARIHLFEFTDLTWYPNLFRSIQTNYLQYVASLGSSDRFLIPLIEKALRHAGTTQIIDLCSGGTGPWQKLSGQLIQAGLPVTVKLTDKYPNPDAIQHWKAGLHTGIQYVAEPVDALNVPSHLKGMRTLFEGFHHFKPDQARSILRDAVEKKEAIGIFDISLRPPLGILILLLSPVMTLISYVVLTPFIHPRTISRFLWTYILPVVPLATCWDGVISLLRGYSVRELNELIEPLKVDGYIWEAGQTSTGTPIFSYSYLLGYPVGIGK